MAEPPHSNDGLEAMAFQVVLQKLLQLEDSVARLARAVQDLPPMLGRILTQLEAQTAQPAVPVARYDDLYEELQAPEVEDEPAAEPGPTTPASGIAPMRPRRLLRWFLREDKP